MTKKILSIFTTEQHAAIFKFEGDKNSIKPLDYWVSKAGDRKIISAYRRLAQGMERRHPNSDYIVFNGLFRQKDFGDWCNDLEEPIRDIEDTSEKTLPSVILAPKQVSTLIASLELAEDSKIIDSSQFQEWSKICVEIERSDRLPVRALACLQGLNELRKPVEKPMLFGVTIPTICGMDIINQIEAFADTTDGGTTMY